MHLNLFTPHPRESLASEKKIDDVRSKVILRLRYPRMSGMHQHPS